jgi:hypothetical protein
MTPNPRIMKSRRSIDGTEIQNDRVDFGSCLRLLVAQPLLAVLTILAACRCTGRSACATKMPREKHVEPPL